MKVTKRTERTQGDTRCDGRSEHALTMPLATAGVAARDRREHRRHDLEQQGIAVERWDGRRGADVIGRIVDISAGGVRIRTGQRGLRADHQVRVRPVGNNEVELAGRLLDMEEMDRGMLGLYLSTQPIAA